MSIVIRGTRAESHHLSLLFFRSPSPYRRIGITDSRSVADNIINRSSNAVCTGYVLSVQKNNTDNLKKNKQKAESIFLLTM